MTSEILPAAGGSYLRDDDTGELVRVEPNTEAGADAEPQQPAGEPTED